MGRKMLIIISILMVIISCLIVVYLYFSKHDYVSSYENSYEQLIPEKIEKSTDEVDKVETDFNNQQNSVEKEEIDSSQPGNNKIIPKDEGNTPTNNNSYNNNSSSQNNNQVNEIKPWDDLGISEYDYYHKPAWKWQTVDFELNGTNPINSCSSESDCRNKCIIYGNQYISEHPGGYSCNTVNSYSGDYLGEYFDFFEVE